LQILTVSITGWRPYMGREWGCGCGCGCGPRCCGKGNRKRTRSCNRAGRPLPSSSSGGLSLPRSGVALEECFCWVGGRGSRILCDLRMSGRHRTLGRKDRRPCLCETASLSGGPSWCGAKCRPIARVCASRGALCRILELVLRRPLLFCRRP